MPAIYGLINQERVDDGGHVIANDGDLALNCQRLTNDMAKTGTLHHSDPLPPGVKGEIIVSGAPNWQAAMDAWMASDVHREILLDPSFKIMGAANSGNYRCVQFS